MDQSYEWDDQGTNWQSLPIRQAICPDEEPKDPRWGGSIQIHVSGDDATVIEDTYSWTIDPKGDVAGPCWHVRKSTSHRSRILKNGVLSEISESTERPPQHSEKPYPPPRRIVIGGITTLPTADDRFLDRLGDATMAGHTCHRVAPKASVTGTGARFELCIFELPRSCKLSSYVQPLELTVTQPGGQVTTHGKTTSLHFGGHAATPPVPPGTP
jgi:hypothetical protein